MANREHGSSANHPQESMWSDLQVSLIFNDILDVCFVREKVSKVHSPINIFFKISENIILPYIF